MIQSRDVEETGLVPEQLEVRLKKPHRRPKTVILSASVAKI
jgi:hypothetical protein